MRVWLLVASLLITSAATQAQDLYMVRTQLSFPEAMASLQQAIGERGQKVSRVQRVDIGLTTFGYQTDKYRVVFYGELQELREVTELHPELIPYLPLKIAIFAEGDETLLLASSFEHLRGQYDDVAMQARFDRWESDLRAILASVVAAD